MTPIEELEKLAGSWEHNGTPDQIGCAHTIESLLPRLRAEARDGKRAAFVAGCVWGDEHWMAGGMEQPTAEAERRYPWESVTTMV